MPNVLITGTSSGLGKSLAKEFLNLQYEVYGISKSYTDLDIHQKICDFSNLDNINKSLDDLINVNNFEYVFLNAGILGKIDILKNISIQEYNNIFNVNVWSNKIILDNILNKYKISKVAGLSSGAAIKTYFGWSLYCCSKSAFKQLISSYSDEFKSTNFVSLCPGLIKSKMQDYIYNCDENKIPSVKKFKKLYSMMETPDIVAKKIVLCLKQIFTQHENNYIDLRKIYNE